MFHSNRRSPSVNRRRRQIVTQAPRLVLFISACAVCSPLSMARGQTELQRQFADALASWKECGKDAVIASQQFQICDANEAENYRQRWIRAIESGRVSFNSLVDIGVRRAAEESPPDADVLGFLSLVMQVRYDIGDYEGAYRVGAALLGAAPDAAELLVRQLLTAFATNRFEECQQLLSQLVPLAGGVPSELTSIASSLDHESGAWKRESELRAAEEKADDLPRVELKIDQNGTLQRIVLELFENEAPNTVANFISLVESGFYDGRSMFRVATHFDATGGCPNDDGTGSPGYLIPSEAGRPDARAHFRGSLGMVGMDATGAAGSQFYMMFAPNPGLNGRSTVFGRVIEGLDVLDGITRSHIVDQTNSKLQKIPDITLAKIESARVLRKRDHEYRPQTITK